MLETAKKAKSAAQRAVDGDFAFDEERPADKYAAFFEPYQTIFPILLLFAEGNERFEPVGEKFPGKDPPCPPIRL